MEKAVYKADVWTNLSDKNYISNFEIFQIIEKCLDIFVNVLQFVWEEFTKVKQIKEHCCKLTENWRKIFLFPWA